MRSGLADQISFMSGYKRFLGVMHSGNVMVASWVTTRGVHLQTNEPPFFEKAGSALIPAGTARESYDSSQSTDTDEGHDPGISTATDDTRYLTKGQVSAPSHQTRTQA